MIPDYFIEEVKATANIVDVINEFVTLKKSGKEYVACCPFHDEKSPSFKVESKAQFYKCFGCSAGGSVIDFLVNYHKNWSFPQAIKFLADKYNLQMPDENVTYKKPEPKNVTALSEKTLKWFQSRGIGQAAVNLMRVTESTEWMPEIKRKDKEGNVTTIPAGDKTCINFNYYEGDELVNIKFRDAKKRFKMSQGGKLTLYNVNSLKDATECFWQEGEADQLTLVQCGILKPGTAVVSVPNGANLNTNNLTYIDNCIDLIKPIKRHHLGFDNDVAGRKLREDVANRLGKDICDYIDWKDKKDANEVLMAYGPQAVIDCCNNPVKFPIDGVFSVSDYSEAIDDMYVKGIEQGVGIGLEKFDTLLRFVRGWITVITGEPSSGKSDYMDQIALGLIIKHNWKFAFYSPENDPFPLHFAKLCRKLIGKPDKGSNKMSRAEVQQAKEFLEDKLWIIKPPDNFYLDTILESVKRLKQERGIDAFVIDAWNRLEHKWKANEAQYVQESLLKLDTFCRHWNVHCFLIAHPTKLEPDKRTGEYPVVRLYNISGGAHFRNIAANGVSVKRNFFGPKKGTTEVHVQKVKFIPYWGEMGSVDMKYDVETGRYNEIVGDNAVLDKSNWITKENRLNKDLPSGPGNDNFNTVLFDNDDAPF